MIRKVSFTFIMAALLFASFANESVASHPFHVTRSEIEFNQDRKTFEVALCVWPEDLQKALSKMEKQKVDLDALSEKKRDELVNQYVASKFRFLAASNTEADASANAEQLRKPAKIRWVGSEIKIKQGWLYFEVDASKGTGPWTIENEIFFELNDDQMNHLEIRDGRKWSSQTISSRTPEVLWNR